MTDPDIQVLSRFRLAPGFRGRAAPIVLGWQIVQATLFACSPQPLYGWRRFLLRCFGATVGRGVLVRPSARIAYPWKVAIGDYAWIGNHAELYSLAAIRIGANAVISQRAYLCAATHDYRQPDFPIVANPITVGAQPGAAADVFVAPGITIGVGAVVGARSSVFKDIPDYAIAMGSPAAVTGRRNA